NNTANGSYALTYNTIGTENTANGAFALNRNTTGVYNTANGSNALYFNTTGYYNTGNGYQSLYSNTTGYNNTANGENALYFNTTGFVNTANGGSSLYSNTSGYANTANGSSTLFSNTTGSGNTANGGNALFANTTGWSNTAIGFYALYNNITGSNNTAVGPFADVSPGNLTYATAIGSDAIVDASNKVRVGHTAVTSIGGQVGWSTFSDGRYKKNIKEDVKGLSFINKLRPITYTVDINGLNEYYNKGRKHDSTYEKMKTSMQPSTDEAAKIVYNGFIAQDVEAAAKKLNYEFSGVDKPKTKDGLYGLRYADFVVPLVKAVQELSSQNENLLADQVRLKSQNDKQQEINESLQKQIDELRAMRIPVDKSDVGFTSNLKPQTSNFSLEQNIPNPFNNSTLISYTLSESFSSAQIIVTDKSGKLIKQVPVSATGKGSLRIDASSLPSATYQYSLLVDGKLIDTKQMILTK
ncbi:MAG TPA: tail fiber domain-containing protein, partial [Parafilimonas sp.]|nr:tail fiber domain-containing protein [Parafilimonas sp.]